MKTSYQTAGNTEVNNITLFDISPQNKKTEVQEPNHFDEDDNDFDLPLDDDLVSLDELDLDDDDDF